MFARRLPTAIEASLLTLWLLRSFEAEKSRALTRARISAVTLRRLGSRSRLRDAFVAEWTDALAQRGWAAFPVSDHFALLRSDTTNGWPRIASTRIRATLDRVRRGDESVFDEIEAELEDVEPPADDE